VPKTINDGDVMKTLILVFLFSCFPLFAQGVEFDVNHSAKNSVIFDSEAPFGTVEGTTDKIDGYLYWNGASVTDNSSFYFQVDLDALDTGIGLRNRHMRENYLQTDKFRYASLKGKIVKATQLSSGVFKVDVQAEMFIHGVTQNISLSGTLSKTGEKTYNIKSDYSVKLSSYNIEIPNFMMMKLNEVVQLHLNFNLQQVIK